MLYIYTCHLNRIRYSADISHDSEPMQEDLNE